jgi:DNA-directed RNA polymerase subunit RPC12/RpoP
MTSFEEETNEKNVFTEKCRECLLNISYDRSEVRWSRTFLGRQVIRCPYCGHEVIVNMEDDIF